MRPGEKLYEELLISGKEEGTPNNKIYKSNEDYLEKEDLNNALNLLYSSVKDNDIKKIKSILKENVEGFKEQ